MNARQSAWLAVVVFATALTLSGQVTTGTISGTVTDSTGAVMPGAEVVIYNEETGLTRNAHTDARGHYSAPSLQPAMYRVTATISGFQTQIRFGIQLTVGREAVVNLSMSVGQVAERVEVSGEAPLVQTTEAAISYLVDDRTIRDLPLNGRDISQLMLLNPGVVQNSNGRWGNADKGFAKRFSISGMRGEDNSYLLDGSYINDYYRHVPAGPTGALTGIETVREFQMLTNSFSAAYGRALRGVFNAVTKSGSNKWHGSAYEFLRNSAVDARNFFDKGSEPPPFKRNQFGATVGGPVFRDKTFFFVAYEGLREALSESGTANVPDLDARRGILPGGRTVGVSPRIVPFMRMFPDPSPTGRNFGNGSAQYFFQAKQPTSENFGQARIDYQLSSNDSLFGRFTGLNANRSSYREYPDRFEVGFLETRLFTFSETHIFSPSLISSFRMSFNRVVPMTNHAVPPPPSPETISVPGQPDMAAFEGFSGINGMRNTEGPGSFYTTNRFAFHDDLNLTLGNHAMQFGGMVERLRYNPYQPFRPYAEWRFADLERFLTATPNRVRGTPLQFGIFGRGIRQTFLALYLQDDWRVTSALSLNLGVRWEPYTVPTEVNGLLDNQRKITDAAPTVGNPFWKNRSWTNFSPRIGFAWSPSQAGKTSLRGGFGLFFVPIDSAVYTVAILNSLTFSPRLQVTLAPADAAPFPNALPIYNLARSTPGTQDIYTPAFDGFDSPHALQYSLSLQRQIGASNVVTLGYSGRRGLNLYSLGNNNLPLLDFDGVSLALPANAQRFNPAYRQINYISNNANAWYNGFTAVFQRRLAAGLQGQISYTYSRVISEVDGSDTGNHVGADGGGAWKYPHDRNANKGLSGYNLTNAFTANYSYDLPFGNGTPGIAGHLLGGWQVTGIVTLQDGGPFTIRALLPRALTDQAGAGSPNLLPGYTSESIVLGGPETYFDLNAFVPPGCQTRAQVPNPSVNPACSASSREIGNYGRNTLTGPGSANWDFGLTKNTQLGERFRLQFRAEVFNLTNRVNFSQPGQLGNSSAANEIFTQDGAVVPSVVLINKTSTTARQIQFGLKLTF